MAIILGPGGKVYNIKLEVGHSGVFFAGGWSQFLMVHDITEANSLLLRYEGNMVFTVKVFETDGRWIPERSQAQGKQSSTK